MTDLKHAAIEMVCCLLIRTARRCLQAASAVARLKAMDYV